MKNEIKAITPAEAGLSLAVIAGPRGSVQDDWPCIEYVCELLNSRRAVIWRGEYRLGVGHVDCKQTLPGMGSGHAYGLLESVLDAWRRGKTLRKSPDVMQAQADLAARFATRQKVTPKLDDVCHSLLMDGATFFDGERFEDWCANYGYDTDSRKAEATFRTCDDIGRALSRSLSRDELTGLREWAGNY